MQTRPAFPAWRARLSLLEDASRAFGSVLWERRWKIASVLAVYIIGRACEIAPPGFPQLTCELLAKLARVLP